MSITRIDTIPALHAAFGTPNRKLPLAGNYNGGEAETSTQWASHFGAARGRKGGAAGWRWGRGLLWGGCDMWARLLKVTGAVKFVYKKVRENVLLAAQT